MTEHEYIEQTRFFVKEKLQNAEAGHDWFHIERVFNNAMLIAADENVDLLVVALGSLLHDIADSKFHDGDEELGPEIARNFLGSLGLGQIRIDQVVDIIRNISFKNSLDKDRSAKMTEELKVVQDADRLDAIGAIGIARAFNYGGYKSRLLYDPSKPPRLNMNKEEYKKGNSPTINHFYEKLLLLKDQMNTATGRSLAEDRHEYMLKYLDQFYKEWNTQ